MDDRSMDNMAEMMAEWLLRQRIDKLTTEQKQRYGFVVNERVQGTVASGRKSATEVANSR